MKLRGTAAGMNLLLEPLDTPESVAALLESRAALLTDGVELELSGAVSGACEKSNFGRVCSIAALPSLTVILRTLEKSRGIWSMLYRYGLKAARAPRAKTCACKCVMISSLISCGTGPEGMA